MGAACWALSSLHPPPTPSIYDRIPWKGSYVILVSAAKIAKIPYKWGILQNKFHFPIISPPFPPPFSPPTAANHSDISRFHLIHGIFQQFLREPFESLRDSRPAARDNLVNTPNSLNQPFSASFVFRRFFKKRLRRNWPRAALRLNRNYRGPQQRYM